MELDDRRSLGRPRVAVGDRDRDRLLERQDVLQLRVAAERIEEALLDGSRVTEHETDVVGEQLLEDREPPGLRHRTPVVWRCGRPQAYQPYRVSPFSRTSTIFWPVRYESGVDRPVMNG